MDLKSRVEELEKKLAVYESSPLVEGYLGVLKQIETCNKDLSEKPAGLRDEDDEKAFDRYNKYILSIDEYYKQLEVLRGKMNPKEQAEVDVHRQKKLSKKGEQVAL
jgi:hypothetical protein